jgi:Flp pilus assembly protein TadD
MSAENRSSAPDELSSRARAHFDEGLRLIARSEWPRAEEEFKRSLQLVPDRVSTLTNLSVTLLSQHKYQEAEAVIRNSMSLARPPEAARGSARQLPESRRARPAPDGCLGKSGQCAA